MLEIDGIIVFGYSANAIDKDLSVKFQSYDYNKKVPYCMLKHVSFVYSTYHRHNKPMLWCSIDI